MENAELIKAAWAEADCKRFCEKYNDCHGCPMPHKESPSYQRMCVDFDEEVLPQLCDTLEAADKRVKELEETQRWIPCAERLPKKEQENQQRGFYLVALENGVVKELAFEFDHYENMLFDPEWHDTAYPVTHWRKLPQPPQKG